MNTLQAIDCLRSANPLPAEPAAPPLQPLLARLDTNLRRLEDPFSAPDRRAARPRPQRRMVALAAAGAIATAAAVVVLAAAPHGGTQNVLADVYKATAPGTGVLHMVVVTETTTGGQTNTVNEELWSAQNPRRLHTITKIDGEVTENALTTSPLKAQRWSQSAPDVIEQSTPDNVLTSEQTPVTWLREAYEKGELTLLGRTTVNGRAVWELAVHTSYPRPTLNGQALPDPTVLVDADTFAPVENAIESVTEEHGHAELLTTKVRYVEYQELPANATDDALLQLDEHPGATEKTAQG
jgi:hypothetical protein